MRVRPLHLVLLIVVILVAVAFCFEASAAPPLTVTQFYQRSTCSDGMCKTRKVERSGQGAVVGRLGDGRCIVVCPAAGRSMGMAYITLPDEEKPISATVLAVSNIHNAALVAFHHDGPLPSINLPPDLRNYVVTQLGELPRRDASPATAQGPVPSKPRPGPAPSGPPAITDPPPVPQPDPGPLPPPPPDATPPAPADSKPQNVTADEFQSLLDNAVEKGVNKLQQFNAAHHAEIMQEVKTGLAKNTDGIQGIPSAVANVGKTLGPQLAKDALSDLLPKVEADAPGWLAGAAKMLGFNTLLGSAGGPLGLAASAIASAWGIGKLLIGRFSSRSKPSPAALGPAPTPSTASVSAPAPPAAGAVSPTTPAASAAPQGSVSQTNQQTIVPVQVADPLGMAMQQATATVLQNNPGISLLDASPQIQQVAQTILDLRKTVSPKPAQSFTL